MTAPHLEPGHVVAGKYAVRSLMAFTGATATYHATDAQGAQLAVKLLDPAIGQRADVMAALDKTAAESAALAHNSVVPVLDAGYDVSTGAPFRATELLTIPSLGRLVETGPLSDEVTAAIVRGLSLALDAAHARGLFHHALKPNNVFVGPAPHYPVLLTDFGARVIHEALPTQEMYSVAAPWLAPEQLYSGVPVGPQTDVYAVALLAFYALTGRPYWWSCQSSPPDIPTWQQEIVAPHVPVSQRARELGRSLNGALDGLFARALAVNPAERPGSVGELAQALAQFAAGVAAPGPPKTQAIPQYAGYSSPAEPQGYQVAAALSPAVLAGPPSQSTVAFELAPPPGGAAPPGMFPVAQAAPVQTPGLPVYHESPPKPKPSGMVPVIIGVVGAVLIGGAVVAGLFLRSPAGESAASSTAAAGASGAASASAGEQSTASGTASATTPTDGGPGETDGGPGAEADKTVEVKFVCTPVCEKIVVDGEELKDPAASIGLLPGKHKVEASKQGYATRTDTITVELGKPLEQKIVLVPTSPGPSPTPTKKKCGKFLKRCD